MSKLPSAAQWNVLATTPTKRILTIAGAFAACLGVCAPAALAQSPDAQGQHQYKALQSISYEFGSNFTSGYFEGAFESKAANLHTAVEANEGTERQSDTAYRDRHAVLLLLRVPTISQ